MDPAGIAAAAQQLAQSFGRLLDAAADYGRGMVDQVAAAAEAERRFRIRQLICVGAMATLVFLGVLFAGVAVVSAFWDTHRVVATASVAAGYLLLAAVAGWMYWSSRRQPAEGWMGQVATLLIAEYLRRRR